MKTYLISDTHLNHANIVTYCQRPEDFTALIQKRWNETVGPEDLVIHLGDVFMGPRAKSEEILKTLNGRKVLVLGNHDRDRGGPDWWMAYGFDFACQALKYRNCWLTHEPSTSLVDGCQLNIHGHLHNIWDGFGAECLVGPDAERLKKELRWPWQRLFALEYTDYRPVEFNKFVAHPDKYRARHA